MGPTPKPQLALALEALAQLIALKAQAQAIALEALAQAIALAIVLVH